MKIKLLIIILCLMLSVHCFAADTAMDSFTDDSASVVTTDYLTGYSGTAGYRWTIASIIAKALEGTAATATALAADPADCPAGQVATGIAASGALSCTATPSVTTLTGNVAGNVSGSAGSATGNAGTATALAANGANCSAGSYPLGVDASGAVESCMAISYPTQASLNVDDLQTLSGEVDGATSHPSFTGSTIPDTSTTKAALQALETAVELRAVASSMATDNSTASHLLCKDDSGHVENCSGVFMSGTSSPIITVTALTPVIDDPDNFAANFAGANLYGGTFIANAAGTAALPNATTGMYFTIVLEGTGATILEPLAIGIDDTIVMNGLAAAQGEYITSSISGAMCVFQYRAADSWMATCNGFAENTPP